MMVMDRHQHDDAATVGVNLTITVQDATSGRVLEQQQLHNLVTMAGLNLMRDLLNERAGVVGVSHLGVGAGSTPAAAGDTALEAELWRDTFTKRTTGDAVLTLTYFLGTAAANGSTLREAGLLNAGAAGTLFARAVHDGIGKTENITVTYNWAITFSAL